MPDTATFTLAGPVSRPSVPKLTVVPAGTVAVPPLIEAAMLKVFAAVLVNVTDSDSGVLCELYTWIGAVTLWPTCRPLSRFPWKVTFPVSVPDVPAPNGTRMSLLPATWNPGLVADPSPTLPVRCTR